MTIMGKAAVLAMLTLATATGMAAESSDLSVAGTIRPAACRVELSDGGRVEYGTIVAASLNQTEGTRLADRYITLGVHCDGAVKFGVIIPDGRPGTVADGMDDLLGSDNLHGLGSVQGRNVGAYTLMFASPTVDGEDGTTLESSNGTTWRVYDGGVTPGLRYMTAWAKPGETTPSSLRDVTTSIRVRAGVAAKAILPPLTDSVPLDGLVTIELKYL